MPFRVSAAYPRPNFDVGNREENWPDIRRNFRDRSFFNGEENLIALSL
jgi:hypothetical protein